jgi:hypothetical protein
MRTLRVAATVVMLGMAPAAWAQQQQCAGFIDVLASDTFCSNIEWIRNRRVTLGCGTGTTYCPTDPVIRLHMAAFMNRLGNVLTPVQVRVDSSPGAIDVDAGAVVCRTPVQAIVNYPRQAIVDLTFSAQAPGDVDIAADLVKSIDGGANWTQLTTVGNRGWIPNGRWGTVANLATTDLAVGDNVIFGVLVTRASGAVDLSDSRCNLRVAIGSRTGAASPF